MKSSLEHGRYVELRDPLHGPIEVSIAEMRVVDAPHFQRLRRIKQLGFAEYVFPGAVHHRYLHSLGAMHLAGRLFDGAARSAPWMDEGSRRRLRQTVRLAALLHDIGHPPLSHAAESLLPGLAELGLFPDVDVAKQASHEHMTLKLILDSGLTEVLAETFGDMGVEPRHIAALIDDDISVPHDTFEVGGLNHRPMLHAMVSGELDVDRMDYLLRDSYFAGVQYGGYDLAWLISKAIAVRDEQTVRLGIDVQALPAFEHFLLARYHMFQMVYFHPKSDIYDAMLRAWLGSVGSEARFPADPEEYASCDDAYLMGRLADSGDPWARRILEQDPLKLVVELRAAHEEANADALEEALTQAGLEPTRLTARPVLSRYASAPAHLRTNPLLVRDGEDQGGAERYHRIEDVTDLFDRYDKSRRVQRFYVIPDHLARATTVVAEWRQSL